MVVAENWIPQTATPHAVCRRSIVQAQEERLGFARLTLAMWPLRPHLASWRRANPDEPWEGALSPLFAVEEGKELSSALRKAVQDIHTTGLAC